MIQEQLTQTVEIDGLLYDSDTGECLGAVDRQFVVDTPEKAEWLMEKLQTLDIEIAAYDARLKALSENIGVMKADKERRKAGLLYRFGADLEKIAQDNMPKGKKTWACAYGTVGFRSTNAKVDIRDKSLALSWAKVHAPESVKVEESVLKSMIPADKVANFIDNPTYADTEGFTVVPAGESSTIKTGV